MTPVAAREHSYTEDPKPNSARPSRTHLLGNPQSWHLEPPDHWTRRLPC
ncbi:MAG TPA: hypothetical protein VFQ44_06215 [Streptosporangiaceae bacterium]|nr:hypothetical protein [Streptosporangiaceae bacterium]